MINNNTTRILILTFISLIVFNTTHAQSDWEFNTSLYGWFAGIDGTVGVASKEKQINANFKLISSPKIPDCNLQFFNS